jgi:hypothetical protein
MGKEAMVATSHSSQGTRNMHSTTTTKSTPTMEILTPDQLDEVSGGFVREIVAAFVNILKTGSPTGDLCDIPSERAKSPVYCGLPRTP